MNAKPRQSMTKAERQKAFDETERIAKEATDRDRAMRQQKNERLRAARLKASKTQ